MLLIHSKENFRFYLTIYKMDEKDFEKEYLGYYLFKCKESEHLVHLMMDLVKKRKGMKAKIQIPEDRANFGQYGTKKEKVLSEYMAALYINHDNNKEQIKEMVEDWNKKYDEETQISFFGYKKKTAPPKEA